jgi:hypothetical protein
MTNKASRAYTDVSQKVQSASFEFSIGLALYINKNSTIAPRPLTKAEKRCISDANRCDSVTNMALSSKLNSQNSVAVDLLERPTTCED